MKKTFINFPANRAPKIQSRRFGHQSFVNTAYKTDGKEGGDDKGEVEIKTAADLLTVLNQTKESLEKKSKEDAKAEVTEQLKAVNEAIDELKNVKPEVTAEELKAIKDEVQTAVKALNILNIRVKGQLNAVPANTELKSFNDILAETIERNASAIQNYRMQQGEVSFDMMPEVKAEKGKEREVKAVGDMSITANFSSAGTFTQDIRSNVIPKPYERTWLGDILPSGTSNGTSILYPKENGGEGGAALWTDPTADKAQMDFDLTGQSAYFKWISGYVIIAREMLDDIAFLTSYLQNKMLISLKIAENAFILNGSSDTNPVTGLIAAATAYNGTLYTKPVDRIIDAAWGQLVEDTFDFYNPTTTILTPRDSVAIGLNKADGSQEYDLPDGSAGFAAGKLLMGGLDILKTTSIGSGNFLTFDKNATMFVKRMQPELRMFEDATLAKKNKVMFRVEERATLAIFNNSALVTGTLTA